MSKSQSEVFSSYLLVLAVAGLLAIWPLPHTMAFRNVLYLVGLLCSCYLMRRMGWHSLKMGLRLHWPVLLFFGWIFFHWIVFSEDRVAQYREMTGFWLRCLIASILGMGLGARIAMQNRNDLEAVFSKNATRILLSSLFGTLLIFLLRYLYEVVDTGILLHTDFYMTPFKGKPQIVVFVGVLLTAIFAGFPSSFKIRTSQMLAVGGLLTVLCCLFVFYVANTKNGFLIFTLLVAAFMLKILEGRLDYKKALLIMLTCSALLAVGYNHVKANPAWNMIVPDIKTGLNIEGHTYWKNWITEPEPKNQLGVEVNQSTYLRTAWFRAAIDLIIENPQGYGLMSYSFSYLAKQKWPDFYSQENDHMVATHSGWTDLTLALGLPALILVQFSLWRSFSRAGSFIGYWYRYIRWTVPTITFMYLTVEVSYDVFFELLFLFLGLFAALTDPKRLGKNGTEESSKS